MLGIAFHFAVLTIAWVSHNYCTLDRGRWKVLADRDLLFLICDNGIFTKKISVGGGYDGSEFHDGVKSLDGRLPVSAEVMFQVLAEDILGHMRPLGGVNGSERILRVSLEMRCGPTPPPPQEGVDRSCAIDLCVPVEKRLVLLRFRLDGIRRTHQGAQIVEYNECLPHLIAFQDHWDTKYRFATTFGDIDSRLLVPTIRLRRENAFAGHAWLRNLGHYMSILRRAAFQLSDFIQQ